LYVPVTTIGIVPISEQKRARHHPRHGIGRGALAYNITNFLRTLALPKEIELATDIPPMPTANDAPGKGNWQGSIAARTARSGRRS
jgi:hypothetical protein